MLIKELLDNIDELYELKEPEEIAKLTSTIITQIIRFVNEKITQLEIKHFS